MFPNISNLVSLPLLLLTLSATLTLATPVADPAPEASPLPDPINAITNLAANTTAKLEHDIKTCTLRLLGSWASEDTDSRPADDTVWWHTYYIYNERGEVIGRASNKPNVVHQGASLLSSLPYTVELRHLQEDGHYNYITFCYASGCYEGDFQCKRYYINNAPSHIGFVNDCKREFDCGHT